MTNLRQTARMIRQDIISMAYKAGAPHIGSSLSIVEILTVLYFAVLKIKPKKPFWKDRDRLLLSKGHACACLYSALARRGFFPHRKLKTFFQNGSDLGGHPDCHLPGIEMVSGSLGHGLAVGAGMALAAKMDRRPFRVFVILSDGECDEGAVWEAALFAANKRLDNLIAIVDYNKLQALGRTSQIIDLEPFKLKWQAFGWETAEVDGHDINLLLKALQNSTPCKKPTVVLAHTVKGKGISFMENDYTWHYKSLNRTFYLQALKELK